MGLTIYVASPLGFSPETLQYLSRVVATLEQCGLSVSNPWDTDYSDRITRYASYDSVQMQTRAFNRLASCIGYNNCCEIDNSNLVLAILDGTEPDSGTVAELGYAVGCGKKVFGLRTDVRNCGDFPGVPVNLQVVYFIEKSGGELFRSIDEMAAHLMQDHSN